MVVLKVEAGLIASESTGKSIVHTAPHHDDIMLSYHAAMHGLLGRSLQPNPTSTSLSNTTSTTLLTTHNGNSNSRMLRSTSFDLIAGNSVATLPALGNIYMYNYIYINNIYIEIITLYECILWLSQVYVIQYDSSICLLYIYISIIYPLSIYLYAR